MGSAEWRNKAIARYEPKLGEVAANRPVVVWCSYEACRGHKPTQATRDRAERAWRRAPLHVWFDCPQCSKKRFRYRPFFDHARGKLGVYELMDVKALASSILGQPADVMTRASLHPMLRKRIEESAVLVFYGELKPLNASASAASSPT